MYYSLAPILERTAIDNRLTDEPTTDIAIPRVAAARRIGAGALRGLARVELAAAARLERSSRRALAAA